MPKAIVRLIGEQPAFGGNDLFIDLIPRTCWFSSIRSSLVESDWDRIRKYIVERAGNKCQCCQSTEKLQVHERWDYIQQTSTRKLMRLISLCQKCHLATHFGRAQIIGYDDRAKQQVMRVRNWNEQQFQAHKRQAFELWRERNKTQWKLDLDLLKENGLRLNKKSRELNQMVNQQKEVNV